MLIRTAGRRFELDTDAGFFLRLPFLGEVFKGAPDNAWIHSPWQQVKVLLAKEEETRRVALAE